MCYSACLIELKDNLDFAFHERPKLQSSIPNFYSPKHRFSQTFITLAGGGQRYGNGIGLYVLIELIFNNHVDHVCPSVCN